MGARGLELLFVWCAQLDLFAVRLFVMMCRPVLALFAVS